MLELIRPIKSAFINAGGSQSEWNDFVFTAFDEIYSLLTGGDGDLLLDVIRDELPGNINVDAVLSAATEISESSDRGNDVLAIIEQFYEKELTSIELTKNINSLDEAKTALIEIVETVEINQPLYYLNMDHKTPFLDFVHEGIPVRVLFRDGQLVLKVSFVIQQTD